MNPVVPRKDGILRGVLLAILWQLVAVIVSAPLLFTCWGLLQWFALIPVYMNRKKRGLPLAAKGVLIAGFLGVLLNATCAVAILGGFQNMR